MLVQLIHLLLTVEIQPDQHKPGIVVPRSKSVVGQKHSAVSFRDSCDATFFATPIYAEAKLLLVVRGGFVYILYRYLRDGAWEF
jgi:ABC-type branched-subunit amino acid transport system substrate-binding protein